MSADLARMEGVRFLAASGTPVSAALAKMPRLTPEFFEQSPGWSVHSLGDSDELRSKLRELNVIKNDGEWVALQTEGEGYAANMRRNFALSSFHRFDGEKRYVVSAYLLGGGEDCHRRLCCGHRVEKYTRGASFFDRCEHCDLSVEDLNSRFSALLDLRDAKFHRPSSRAELRPCTVAQTGGAASPAGAVR